MLAASVAPLVERRLLWARRTDRAPALGGFHVCPGGLVEAEDARAPHAGGPEPNIRVTALRELFEEVDLLHAHGAAAISDGERRALRDLYREDVRAGSARFAALGLRWRTAELEPIGRWVTPSFADRRFDTFFFALQLPVPSPPDPDLLELEDAEWIDAGVALGRWSRAEVVIAPPLATLLRSLDEHGTLRADDLRSAYGAAGEESQCWEVVPSIQMLPFRTPTLPPATHTNSYLVGSREAVLIEPATPYPDELERAFRWIEEARGRGIVPHAILLTHHHPDHVGGARALGERLGLPLWAHRLTAERLAGELHIERLLADGERITLDGPKPLVLRAIHTPGHAPGHLCFLEETSRAMVVGDMVAGVGSILVEPIDGDMALYLESLRRMDQEEPSVLLPAHGWPLRDARGAIARYIAHRLERERKVHDALVDHGGPATVMELLPAAYDDAPRAVWPLAAQAAEAHLIKLEREGRARRTAAGWMP